jgi:hypothetical protein
MSLRWSFSTDRDFRRCQRQFFFKHIAASHASTEGWRREAFILRQLKTLELRRGTVIDEGVQHYVVPALRKGNPLNWKDLTEQTLRRAERQLAFSADRRYREPGIAKGKQENFCALVPHETGQGISAQEFEGVCQEVRIAFGRLAEMSDLWTELLGRKDCHPEKQLWVKFDDASIMVQLDLVFERQQGRPTIIDWKSYEIGGDTDARLQTALYGWALWRSNFYAINAPANIDLLECQVMDGVVIKHECSQEVFDEVEDYIYRSLHRIFSLCRSKKLSEAKLEDFAFTDNPNNCEHCVFRELCVERALASSADEAPKATQEQKVPAVMQASLL